MRDRRKRGLNGIGFYKVLLGVLLCAAVLSGLLLSRRNKHKAVLHAAPPNHYEYDAYLHHPMRSNNGRASSTMNGTAKDPKHACAHSALTPIHTPPGETQRETHTRKTHIHTRKLPRPTYHSQVAIVRARRIHLCEGPTFARHCPHCIGYTHPRARTRFSTQQSQHIQVSR